MKWKKLFASRILERGYEYYRDGMVSDFTADGDSLNATVIGTEDYEVEITLQDGEVEEMFCTCPYAEDGNNCKHMAAVLCQWEAEQSSDGAEAGESGETDREKSEITQLIEEADEQTVKRFLASALRKDALFLAQFRKAVKQVTPKDAAQDCIRMVDALCIHYTNRDGFIEEYQDVDAFVSALADILNDDVQRMIDSGAYPAAFQVSNYIFGLIGSVEIDDASGELLVLAEMIEDIWRTLCKKVSAAEKWELFREMQALLRGGAPALTEGYAAQVLLDSFPEEEFRQPRLLFVEKMLREAQAKSGDSWAEYTINDWTRRYLSLLEREPDADAQIETFCQECVEYRYVREYYINFCMARKNYAQALKTLDTCLELSRDYRGLRADYSRKKKEIYLLLGDHEAYLRQLWKLVLEDDAGGLDEYKELKRQYSPAEWEKQREAIFRKLPKYISRAPLYQEDGLYDRLLDCVVNSPGLRALKHYKSDLQERYPAQLLRKYKNELEDMARSTSDRKTYQLLVEYLREMQQLAGGEAVVAAMVEDWKLRYQRRPAMMQELDRL